MKFRCFQLIQSHTHMPAYSHIYTSAYTQHYTYIHTIVYIWSKRESLQYVGPTDALPTEWTNCLLFC